MSNCFQSPERCRRRSSNRWLSTKKRRKRKERKETFCLPFQLFLSYLRFSLAVEASSTIGLCVSTLWVAFFPICRIRHVEPNHQVCNDRKVNVSHNHLNLVGLRGLLVLLLLSSWSSSVLMYDGESPLSIEIAVCVCVCVYLVFMRFELRDFTRMDWRSCRESGMCRLLLRYWMFLFIYLLPFSFFILVYPLALQKDYTLCLCV